MRGTAPKFWKESLDVERVNLSDLVGWYSRFGRKDSRCEAGIGRNVLVYVVVSGTRLGVGSHGVEGL